MNSVWYKVITPVTDIWQKPRFESGRENQCLFGEILHSSNRRGEFVFAYTEDNYSGWVRQDHLREIESSEGTYATAIISSCTAKIYNGRKSNSICTKLSFGSIVSYDEKYRHRIKLREPSGWVNVSNLLLRKKSRPTVNKVIKTLKIFQGVPYLWGGRSGFGLDCSGLVQLVYNYHGLLLPRDTKDQVSEGSKVARKNMQPGDLIFSPGHVSVYIGHKKILHASLKAGCTAIESIDPKSKLYRKDIAENIIQIGRVL